MRKRSKYRPKGVIVNTMGYVLEGLTPVAKHSNFLMTLKIANHAALAALTQGKATNADITVLINALNISEGLYRLGFGREYGDVLREGLTALRDVGRRGHKSGRYVLYAHEMTALNTIMELHDAQLDLCTVNDLDRAIDLVNEEHRLRKTQTIVEKNT